jgi:fructokinase
VSTIGAGDNFNAGIVYGLIKNNIKRNDLESGLTEEQWDAIISTAQQFSAEACKTLFNYVSPEFGAQRRKELQEALAQEQEQ